MASAAAPGLGIDDQAECAVVDIPQAECSSTAYDVSIKVWI